MNDIGIDDLHRQRTNLFRTFLEEEGYESAIGRMIGSGTMRLTVNVDDVRQFEQRTNRVGALATNMFTDPTSFLPACEQAIEDIALADKRGYALKQQSPTGSLDVRVSVVGSFGEYHCTPRWLTADRIGKLVSVEGIVTRVGGVHPKIAHSVHYNPKKKEHFHRGYVDRLSAAAAAGEPVTSAAYPTTDGEGDPLEMEPGLSTFIEQQTIVLQEMPERTPAGQLARSVEVVLERDLVDKCKAGDRVQVVGVFRSIGSGANAQSAVFKTLLVANFVTKIVHKAGSPGNAITTQGNLLSDADQRQINELAQSGDAVFSLLARSLAPSIFGHDKVKEAMLLMLLGGNETNIENGSHLRGDINVLLVGDPSTAKSQLLRYVLNTAPVAIATTGRGSSGVGLTAAVTTDRDTGDRRLEAGAMVLADRGVVCIDEFDKMSDVDRVAIHEVMEQQTVTVAKAGIQATLNARCSVFAAANPVYGQYDVHKDPHQNIALPDSLLSRFDLLFVITDEVDPDKDRALSEHVLKMHRYVPPGVRPGDPIPDTLEMTLNVGADVYDNAGLLDRDQEQAVDETIYETTLSASGSRQHVLKLGFLQKYISVAKATRPVLLQTTSDYITAEWAELRNMTLEKSQRRTSPITARTLETLIRLSTAHAKARLSAFVEPRDAIKAVEILRFALFKELPTKYNKRQRRAMQPESAGSESEDDFLSGASDSDMESAASPSPAQGDADEMDVDNDNFGPVSSQPEPVPNDRFNLFRSRIAAHLLNIDDAEPTTVDDAAAIVNEGLSEPFSWDETLQMLRTMSSQNMIYLMQDESAFYKI